MVTAPLIGRVAQVAVDRLLGTFIGGGVGYLCFLGGYHVLGLYGRCASIARLGHLLFVLHAVTHQALPSQARPQAGPHGSCPRPRMHARDCPSAVPCMHAAASSSAS